MADQNMVTIPVTEYEELKAAANELASLGAAGVDNWEGYGEAMRALHDDYGDDDDDDTPTIAENDD